MADELTPDGRVEEDDVNSLAHRIVEQATGDSQRQYPESHNAELWHIALGSSGDVVNYPGGHTFRVGETIEREDEDGLWRIVRIEVDPDVIPRLIVERA